MLKVTNQSWKWAAPIIIISFVLDQFTKSLILAFPTFAARECLFKPAYQCGKIEISQIFDLSMVWNYGMSFGMMQSQGIGRWILLLVTLGIAIGFTIWMLRADRWQTVLALAFVIGGALGNMIDRMRFGAVVDFLDFSGPWFNVQFDASGGLFGLIDRTIYNGDGLLGLGFPYVFNVADMAITLGAIILIVDQMLAKEE
jgi:signal peptidase II